MLKSLKWSHELQTEIYIYPEKQFKDIKIHFYP